MKTSITATTPDVKASGPHLSTAPTYYTDHGAYLLRRQSFAHPSECDGCGRNTASGYTVYFLGHYDGCHNTGIWACRVDCAVNSILAGEGEAAE
jgi:hypothetical protein